MGKSSVAGPVLKNVGRLITRDHRLEKEDGALVHATQSIVMNCSDDGVLPGQTKRPWPQPADVQFDLNSKILANPTDDIGQIVKRHFGISSAVRDNDVTAVATNELIKAKI